MNALTAFFLGQLSLALLIFCFIKYFIFGEPPPTDASSATKRRLSSGLLRTPRLRRKRSALLRPDPPVQPSAILSKTFYNVSGHLPESLDWFNVLLAQTLAQLRTEALHDDALLKSLDEVLNGAVKPDFVGPITITELALGEEFPIFSNCRIIPVDEGGVEVKSVGESTRLLARLDVDLSDAITLGVETKLMLNYPVPLVAVLPVALAVSVVRFSGTISLSFIPSTTTPKPADEEDDSSPGQTTLAFSFLPDYRLDLSVRSLLGSRSRLQDVPKIAQLVEARIHAWLKERCVEPRYQQIVLPSLWPRRKNTRGGEEDDEQTEDVDHSGDSDNGHSEPLEIGADPFTEGAAQPGASDLVSDRNTEGRRKNQPTKARPRGVTDGVRYRDAPLRQQQSTEDLRIPGRFD